MCARGAGTNGDVLNVHTETCVIGKTSEIEHFNRMLGSSLIDNFLFSMNGPHMGYHVLQRFTERNPCIFRIFKFENRSNTKRSPFHQSFALPVQDVELQS